jgi:hypothetical protein
MNTPAARDTRKKMLSMKDEISSTLNLYAGEGDIIF